MSKTTAPKTATKKVAETTPVPVAPTTPVTPAKEKKVKAPAAAVVAAEPAVDHAEVDAEAVLVDQSVEFLAKLQQLGTLISSLKTEYKTLEKKWVRELKTAQKLNTKRKRKAGNRAPSGFVKPTKISDELAKFLEKPSGSEMARTEVTRDINKYIRTNNLQDKDNGRKINPDTKLAALLKLKKTDELTYFNLQRYMSPHFAKAVKDAAAAVAVAA
jgi:upstream activation factor subunit UAF30